MSRTTIESGRGIRIVFPVLLTLLAVLAHHYNLLLFHTLIESYTIFVALTTFIVAWYTYQFSRNNFLMYLGVGFLFVAALDLLHTFTFENMALATDSGVRTTTQFWIAARYLQALVLVSAPFFVLRRFDRSAALGVYGTLTLLAVIAIFAGYFPVTYVSGTGLTPFKIGSEYTIMALFACAIWALWRQREHLDAAMVNLLTAASLLMILGEFTFTFYVALSDLPILFGHLFKFVSFWLIFLAVIQTTLTKPFHVMARGSSTYDAIPDAISVVDREGRIGQVNRAACTLTGRAERNLVGQHCHDVFHPSEINVDDCPVCDQIRRGRDYTAMDMKYGDGRWANFALSPIEAAQDRPGVVHVYRDITEPKRAEDALRRARDELEQHVQNRTADLLAANRKLQEEIGERKQVQHALIAAKNEAEAANRAKSDFLSRMSHELRTPLNAILGFAQLLKADPDVAQSEVQVDNVDHILQAGWHLLELIDEVLDLAKIESGRRGVNLSSVPLRQALINCVALSRIGAERRGIRILCDFDAVGLVCVRADAMHLKQVLINLLTNAIKYNRDNGRIELRAEIAASRVRLLIGDTGAGIPQAKLAELFQPFNRLGAEFTQIEGTGIGLVICKRLVELMGGTITVETEVGRGSTFCIELARGEDAGNDT